MGIDPSLLRARSRTPGSWVSGASSRAEVRDCYVAGERRFIVVSDRVRCFDVVVGTL